MAVVVASFRELDVLASCLESLRPQCRAHGAELVVARHVAHDDARARRLLAGCRLVDAKPTDDIPRLRGIGLGAVQAEWIAVTEDHCVADPGWLSALQAAGAGGAEVLGGSMGNRHRARRIDCGAFFSEYGFFGAAPVAAGAVGAPLVTGANVAYRDVVVERVAAWAQAGDWENVIHDRLFRDGHAFRLVPEARVCQNLHYSLGAFARDRYAHGRDFAATRARALPRWRRVLLAAATPLLPPVLARRIARAVHPAERPHFLRALPATLAFLSAWSAGEAVGYIFGHASS